MIFTCNSQLSLQWAAFMEMDHSQADQGPNTSPPSGWLCDLTQSFHPSRP